MPISDNEYSYDSSNDQNSNCDSIATSTTGSMMSKAELRKTHKPIMEKKRRAKINNCLNEIKDLILTAMKKDPERHSKLEKADILEMAVKHLKSIQKQQKEIAIRSDPNLALKYKSGYLECATEVTSYVDQIDGADMGLKHRLTTHLNKCANTIDQPHFPNFTSSSLLASFAAQSRFNKSDDQNNNARTIQSMGGIELIPSCLPNGDFAFLVPKSSFSSMMNSAPLSSDSERPSAFVTVPPRLNQSQQNAFLDGNGLLKISKPLSPPMSPEMPKMPQPTTVKVIKPKAEKMQSVPFASKSGNLEIQSIKFPIHKKEFVSEPLCIITNNGERYRQAQQVEDTRHTEENAYSNLAVHPHSSLSVGVKRKAKDDGLLALVPQVKYAKIDKIDKLETAGSGFSAFKKLTHAEKHDNQSRVFEFDEDNSSSGHKSTCNDTNANNYKNNHDDDDKNEPMWRPW